MYDQLKGMDEILDDFVIETNEIIDQLNEDLLILETEGSDEDLINRVFRAYHTIKGTSGFLSFDNCTKLAHAAEDILNTMRNGELEPSPSIMDVLLETVDWFSSFMTDVESREENDEDISELVGIIEGILNKNGQDEDIKEETMSDDFEEKLFDLADIPKELITEFYTESSELLDSLNTDLLNLESSKEKFDLVVNEELVNNIFRAFHTLKGNSGLLSIEDISKVAHKSEDIMNLIRGGNLIPSTEVIDVLLLSVDWIKESLEELQENTKASLETTDIFFKLSQVFGDTREPKKGKSEPLKRRKKPRSTPTRTKKKIDQTIRVDIKRLDTLMNLAGELVLGKNRLSQVTGELNRNYAGDRVIEDLDEINNSLGYVTTEIQESVMQMRMLPISHVFRKFPRLVRDLAREKKKDVELVLSGEDTELDRSVIESIGDPLVHLLRNAIDHGIESPEIRKKQGKPSKGTVHLSAFQEGNQIIIEITDDGAGIDTEVIKQKAISKNLITKEEANSLLKSDLVNLIFKPGFSTAEVVTNVSGRGVGMDVVKSNISKLNGSVDIKTEKGEGSIFTIKIPLTLTILTGMVIKVSTELYIIPLISLSETLKLRPGMISYIQGQEVFRLRDSIVPLIRMNELLNLLNRSNGQSDSYIVVVSLGEKRLGLVVSELLGQEETVVKPLGQALGKVAYVAGATIRGDGRVCLIIDVPDIIKELSRNR